MIIQKIQTDIVSAMKLKDQKKVTTLRYALAQIRNKEVEKKAALTDEEVYVVMRKVAKELKESIEAFDRGGRKDLIDEYSHQLSIITPYLPPEMSDDELRREIQKLKEANKTIVSTNPKALIGIVMKALRGKADLGRIMRAIQSSNS